MPGLASIECLTYAYPVWADCPSAALAGVDLVVDAGVTVLTGDSGAGKSTLLRVLNGLVPHLHGGRISGRASVSGLDVFSTPTRQLARHVGFVFQEPEVGFVRGTVEREVAFGPENLGFTPGTIRRNVGAAMEQVGIGHLAGRRLRTLSGGERQRVALAGVLASAPTILALDEPTSQLDTGGAERLADLLADLAAAGRAVVAAEHRVGRLPCPDRVVNLSGGAVAPPEEHQSRLVDPVAIGGTADSPRQTAASFSLVSVTMGVAGRALAEGIDLAGFPGEVLILTGSNGAGKTTLLRTVAGLTPALSGTVERRPGRVAYLPQEPGLLLHRPTVRAEVEQTLRWSHPGEQAGPVLDLLGLSSLADRDPRDLSGGQRQRAALAVVLAGQPMLALLDEPTRGMDATARVALAATIRRLASAGATVIMATHDLDLAAEMGGRRVHLEDGRLRPVPVSALA